MTPNRHRLERVIAAVSVGALPHDDDQRWFAEALATSLQTGKSLDSILGLTQRGGLRSLARANALKRRNDALAELHTRHFAGLAPRPAAIAILALADRRRRTTGTAGTDMEVLLDAAMLAGSLPRASQLTEILRLNAFELEPEACSVMS